MPCLEYVFHKMLFEIARVRIAPIEFSISQSSLRVHEAIEGCGLVRPSEVLGIPYRICGSEKSYQQELVPCTRVACSSYSIYSQACCLLNAVI